MFKKVAVVVVVLIVAVLLLAAARPSTFRVQRAVTIKAPPEAIFPLINDFHRWGSWSPYEKLDPAMKKTYSGAERGEGAVYAWESQGKAGVGRMAITRTLPPANITIALDFAKPFASHNVAEFTLESRGESTSLTWAMAGPQPYVAKLMGLFLNMDKLVGNDFETGLTNLKRLAEK